MIGLVVLNLQREPFPGCIPVLLTPPHPQGSWYPGIFAGQALLQPLASCPTGVGGSLPLPPYLLAAANASEEGQGTLMLPLELLPWMETACKVIKRRTGMQTD